MKPQRLLIFLSALYFSLLSFSVHAEDDGLIPLKDDAGSSSTWTYNHNNPAGIEYRSAQWLADRKLNHAYAHLLKSLSDDEGEEFPLKQRLKTAQLAWIRFRDLQIDFEMGPYKGNGGNPAQERWYEATTSVTLERLKTLERLMPKAELQKEKAWQAVEEKRVADRVNKIIKEDEDAREESEKESTE